MADVSGFATRVSAGLAGLFTVALMALAPAAQAQNATAQLELKASPVDTTDDKARASLSRNATATEPAADFRAAYTVSVTNPTNSSDNFRFVAHITVPEGDGGTAPPTQFVSSRPDCKLTASDPVTIECRKIDLARRGTVTFSFEFRTPTAGASMNLAANLFFPATKSNRVVTGNSSIELVKLQYKDYTLGFNTFVPKTGGTFFSGISSSLAGSPGGVATSNDPFTTTIVVPPIAFTTTALVEEDQTGSLTGCSAIFGAGGCFESNVTIPSDESALAGLVIYLRIDQTKITPYPLNRIGTVEIRYTKNGTDFITVPNCSAPGVTPVVKATTGVPCIRERKAYGYYNVAPEWQLDWEFKIEAVDNGRYVNL